MDKITTNPRGLGSKSFKISHTHLLLSPYNPNDHEHNSNLLDTYERERIARDLEYYVNEAAKSTTTNVKFNGLTGNDRQIGLRRVMSMPRERYIGGGGGMKNKSTEKKSKEQVKVSRPPERDTGVGGMKKSETERKGGGGHRRAMSSMPWVRDTSVDGGGDGMKNGIEKRSKERTQASMPPERNTGGGGGGMKNKSEKKAKEITKASMLPERDTGGGGGGGMKKKSEKKNMEITKASGLPERDTSGGGGGGMMKKSETRRKAIIQGNFWLKHASTVCSTMECDVVGFGRDFLRARMAAGRPPRTFT